MQNQLIPITDVERMATAIAKSGLFGVKTADQALALMLIAQAEGMHPALAARDYHIIQGRPTLKADAMLARYQAAGGIIEWHDYTDTVVAATFKHPCSGNLRVEWTVERAKAADLTGNPNWRKYPRQMLKARVISEGVRTSFPSCCVGVYTPEEAQDFDEMPKASPAASKTTRTAKDTQTPKPAQPAPVSAQPAEDAVIVQPEAPAIEQPKQATQVPNTAGDLAAAITKARNGAIKAGLRDRAECFECVSLWVGREISEWSQATVAELAKVADRFASMAAGV